MRIGIDLVHIPGFKERLEKIDRSMIFSDEELQIHTRLESLAGAFAAKEAFFKATGLPIEWRAISVLKEEGGRPRIESSLLKRGDTVDISISHDGEYAIAAALFRGISG